MLTLDKIYHAKFILKQVARKTDLIAAPRLCPGTDLYLKTENLQVTGSFKVRGAYYKISQLSKEESDKILSDLEGAEYIVQSVKKGTRKKSPTPPFITSTLQQEASRRLSFQAKRTMKAAQELYEGVEVAGHGTLGLITYCLLYTSPSPRDS